MLDTILKIHFYLFVINYINYSILVVDSLLFSLTKKVSIAIQLLRRNTHIFISKLLLFDRFFILFSSFHLH